jgi:hypothetical protein
MTNCSPEEHIFATGALTCRCGEIKGLSSVDSKPPDAPRVFCVSWQRSGTTSVGKFYRDHGFRWSGWNHEDGLANSLAWYNGDLDPIFDTEAFRTANAFEDAPWNFPGVWQAAYHRFPNSKFVLMHRDPDAWWRSLVAFTQAHAEGTIVGPAAVHAKSYGRLAEYLKLLPELDETAENVLLGKKSMTIAGLEEHYKDVYRLHNAEVQDFFRRNDPTRLFVCSLEDPEKWQRLGAFLGVDVAEGYDAHEHALATAVSR